MSDYLYYLFAILLYSFVREFALKIVSILPITTVRESDFPKSWLWKAKVFEKDREGF